ncbi:MAG: hypothetical protein WKG07_07615 [Hymenobacter sp.]
MEDNWVAPVGPNLDGFEGRHLRGRGRTLLRGPERRARRPCTWG